MMTYGSGIAPFIREILCEAAYHRQKGNAVKEFACLEDAHVLGQESTYWHTKVHLEMLFWGVRNRSLKEVLGQVLRVVGALTKTAIGMVPEGNKGGSNVSPFRAMSIRADLSKTISDVRTAVQR